MPSTTPTAPRTSSLRHEDEALLRGAAHFTDDHHVPGEAYGCFVRSACGHARIKRIDLTALEDMPGVVKVLTAADVKRAGLGAIAPMAILPGRDGKPMFAAAMPVLADDVVRYVGEPVALVVADTAAKANDAAAAVYIDYEMLPAVSEPAAAVASGAPQLWPQAPGNIGLDWEHGNVAAVDQAMAGAAHRVAVNLRIPRVAPSALEPRAAVAQWDAATDRYKLTAGTQGVSLVRRMLAEQVFKVAPEKIQVVTHDVGGGFGMKVQTYSEYAALLLAARLCERPVHWCATRLESFLSDTHGRDVNIRGELALDAQGRFLGLRAESLVGIGAYTSTYVAIVATNNTKNCLSSVYRIPQIHTRVKMVHTNAAPLAPYRGAGRPDAIYLVETLIDKAAREMGIDRVDLRRRNLIPSSAMPYAAPSGQTYDSGEFEAVLDKALVLSDWAGFAQRKALSQSKGMLRGIGICTFLEVAGGAPLSEQVDMGISRQGIVTACIGAQPMGQGLVTVMTTLVAEAMQVDRAQVRLRVGDSDHAPQGIATVASRSSMMTGSALRQACDALIDAAKGRAQTSLGVPAEALHYRDGAFVDAGSGRSAALAQLAQDEPIQVHTEFASAEMSFPNGCHICEVEIDPETGVVRVVGYAAVDDVGNMLHPTLVEGQIQGGVAQGLGQVLGEQLVYDEQGQLLTGSFMDYHILRADEMPQVRTGHHVVPCTTNPLGAKGAGESGVTGSVASAANAIRDALHGVAAGDIDLPMTPVRIWTALQSSGRATA